MLSSLARQRICAIRTAALCWVIAFCLLPSSTLVMCHPNSGWLEEAAWKGSLGRLAPKGPETVAPGKQSAARGMMDRQFKSPRRATDISVALPGLTSLIAQTPGCASLARSYSLCALSGPGLVSTIQTEVCQVTELLTNAETAKHSRVSLSEMVVYVDDVMAASSQQVPTTKDIKAYEQAMEWFKKAQALIGTPKENSDEQAELFKKAIAIRPEFIEAHYDLGLIFATQKKPEEAVKEFEAVRKLDAKFEGVYQLLATNYRDLGRNEDAAAALEEGLKQKPKDLPMLRALAFLQLHLSDDSSAIPTLQAILELEPQDADARMSLGIVFDKHNRLEEAAQSYRAALELEPKDFALHYDLALVLLRQQKIAEATVELEAADKLSPGNAELLERLGDAYSFQDSSVKAAVAYQAAVAKVPDRAVLLSKLGFALAKSQQVPGAVAALERSIKLDPSNPDSYYLLGDLYSELNRIDDAVAAYAQSLKLNPKQKEVHYNLGTLYAEEKQYAEAQTELKAAVDLDPDYAAAWSNLAVVCEKLEQQKEAIEAHEKVVTLGKAKAGNFFSLGILYCKENLPDKAVPNFAKAIQLEPDKYRQILREELKNLHSVLDCVRYRNDFVRLLSGGL